MCQIMSMCEIDGNFIISAFKMPMKGVYNSYNCHIRNLFNTL